MKAALDVHYRADQAFAACVMFRSWQDAEPLRIVRSLETEVAQYQSGRFFERELPCLLSVLRRADQAFDTIIIDGFVHLRPEVGKGLGTHLAEACAYTAVIIGVAKNRLAVADRFVPVLRGRGKSPLFVSATGCDLDLAAASVKAMHGPYRIPTLLKIADQQSRAASSA